MYISKNIRIKDLHQNKGQVQGLPKNPRFIKDERFEALKKSIEDAPEMLSLRELIVYDNDGEYVVIGGNMRLRAMRELGMSEAPCKVLSKETEVYKLKEYAIKDNVAFGQTDWDVLENEWSGEDLEEWGMENVDFSNDVDENLENYNSELPSELQGLELEPEKLDKINGDDETLMERVIIVFPKDKRDVMAKILGLESIDKVVYKIDEFENEK